MLLYTFFVKFKSSIVTSSFTSHVPIDSIHLEDRLTCKCTASTRWHNLLQTNCRPQLSWTRNPGISLIISLIVIITFSHLIMCVCVVKIFFDLARSLAEPTHRYWCEVGEKEKTAEVEAKVFFFFFTIHAPVWSRTFLPSLTAAFSCH